MKNFFLYYNKQNHILFKELTRAEHSDEFVSQVVDEPFFVLGIYINSKKYNSTDLTPFEQSFCISDNNHLDNVQPNHFRDSYTSISFSASSLFGADNNTLRFNFPTHLMKDTIYQPESQNNILHFEFDSNSSESYISHQTDKYENTFYGHTLTRLFSVTSDIFFFARLKEMPSELFRVSLLINEKTNTFSFLELFAENGNSENWVYDKTTMEATSGLPYLNFVNNDGNDLRIYYSNSPIADILLP